MHNLTIILFTFYILLSGCGTDNNVTNHDQNLSSFHHNIDQNLTQTSIPTIEDIIKEKIENKYNSATVVDIIPAYDPKYTFVTTSQPTDDFSLYLYDISDKSNPIWKYTIDETYGNNYIHTVLPLEDDIVIYITQHSNPWGNGSLITFDYAKKQLLSILPLAGTKQFFITILYDEKTVSINDMNIDISYPLNPRFL